MSPGYAQLRHRLQTGLQAEIVIYVIDYYTFYNVTQGKPIT